MEDSLKAVRGRFFSRGAHVPDNKALTKDNPIEVIDAQDLVLISLGQHIGKPAEPVVNIGDEVFAGQLIGKETGFVSANIYSSVSGVVEGIEERPNPNGTKSTYVIIRNDKEYHTTTLLPMDNKDPQSIIARVREAGIVGMGGAGFPTAVKLAPKTPVDTLIINGAECEPYLTCDYRLMLEKTEEVVSGIRLLAKALNVTRIYVGIELNKPKAIELFEKYDDLQVVALKKRYPMGSEKHLIYSCTGRRVPVGKLPADVGCIVDNVATCLAVYEAVELNKPLYERAMTVSGRGCVSPKNLQVRNGTSYAYLIKVCGEKENIDMYVAGGPMMGPAMLSTDVYTTKTSSGFLMLSNKEIDKNESGPCISCGRCANACPMKLLPMQIDFYTQAGDYEKADKIGGVSNCISCGSCAFVCPAKRELVQSITLCKAKLAEKRRKEGNK